AIEEAFAQSARRFARMTAGMTPAQSLNAYVDAYVSMEHRANASGGCPIAALVSDLPRQAKPGRLAYETGGARPINRPGGWVPGARPRPRRLAAGRDGRRRFAVARHVGRRRRRTPAGRRPHQPQVPHGDRLMNAVTPMSGLEQLRAVFDPDRPQNRPGIG